MPCKFTNIDQCFSKFLSFSSRDFVANYTVKPLDEFAFVLIPRRRSPLCDNREIDITFLALTHGDEVGGAAVLLTMLEMIEQRQIEPLFQMAFLYGNTEAAARSKRFLTSDLNRSFGLANSNNSEERRAKHLERIFRRSSLLIDFHQTVGHSETHFFISQFDPLSFRLIKLIQPPSPFVTYWNSNFSQKGMTTLNFHIANGGHGFAIELGEKGFEENQVRLGVNLIESLISRIENLNLGKIGAISLDCDPENNVFIVHRTISASTIFSLLPGWKNLSPVSIGQALGKGDGKDFISDLNGRILFPRYPMHGESIDPGSEVCRLLRKATRSEIIGRLNETETDALQASSRPPYS